MNWIRSRALYLLGIDLSWVGVNQILSTSDSGKMSTIENSDFVLLEEVLLHAPSGHAFSLDSKKSTRPLLIKESSYWEPIHAQYSHGLVPKPKLETLNLTNIVGSIPQSTNYFHWLVDELPVILRMSQSIRGIVFVHNGNFAQYQIEAIEALKLELLEIEPWAIIQKFALSKNRKLSGEITPENLETLEKYSKEFGSLKTVTKIYISRRLSRRSLKNEEKIEEILSMSGFQILQLEYIHFIDQIQIFKNAEIVIGAHGAGLANIVFCSKGTRIIEFYRQDYFNPCYEDIATAKNFFYQKIEYGQIESLLIKEPASKTQELLHILSIDK